MLPLMSALVIGLIAEEGGGPVAPVVAALIGPHLDFQPWVYRVEWCAWELHRRAGLELEALESLQAWTRLRPQG